MGKWLYNYSCQELGVDRGCIITVARCLEWTSGCIITVARCLEWTSGCIITVARCWSGQVVV